MPPLHLDFSLLEAVEALPWDERDRVLRQLTDEAKLLVGEFARLRAAALREGIAELGTATAVAAKLGISQQAVSKAAARRR